MKHRSFLLALVLGLLISSQALLSSEQDIMPSSAQCADEELQQRGWVLFCEYIKDAFESGKRINKDHVNNIIALYQLEPYRKKLSPALSQCYSCPCCSMVSPLFFKYLQDFIELEIIVVDKDFDLVSGFNKTFFDFKAMLCMDQDLLVAYQETMEFVIAKGLNRSPYDDFMVEFDAYKNSPTALLCAYLQNYVKHGVVVSDVEDLIREIIYNAPCHLPYDLKEKFSADEHVLAIFQDAMEFLIARGFNPAAYDDFMVEFESYKSKQIKNREDIIDGASFGAGLVGAAYVACVLHAYMQGNLQSFNSANSYKFWGAALVASTVFGAAYGAKIVDALINYCI